MAVPGGLWAFCRRPARDHNLLDQLVMSAVAPLQWATAHGQRAVGRLVQRTLLLGQAQQRAEQLATQAQQLAYQLSFLGDLAQENRRLRRLVGLRERAGQLPLVAAEIIATSPSPMFRSVRIDRGRRHGLHLGAAVLAPSGVVGRIAAVSELFADVLLLSDSTCSLDVVVVRTRARARVHGTGELGGLQLATQYLPRSADVEPGDELVTSGLGGTFPKGLRVGTIDAIRRQAYGLYQEAEVAASVDFGRLEELMVVAGEPQAVRDVVLSADADGPRAPDVDGGQHDGG